MFVDLFCDEGCCCVDGVGFSMCGFEVFCVLVVGFWIVLKEFDCFFVMEKSLFIICVDDKVLVGFGGCEV